MKKIVLSAVVLFLAVTAVGCKGGNNTNLNAPDASSSQVEQEEEVFDPNSVAVEVEKVKKRKIEEKSTFSGTVLPIKTVEVASPRSGVKVNKVNFDVGDNVSAGDILFALDTSDIENNISVLNANLESADVNIKSAETELSLVEGSQTQIQIQNHKDTIAEAERNYQAAKTTLQNAERDYNSGKALFEQGAISQNEFTELKNSYDDAVRKEASSNDTLNTAKYNYDIYINKTIPENKKRAQDTLNSAVASKNAQSAQMRSYQKDLADSNVNSPISGTVLECNAVAGSILNGTPFVIVDLSTVKIEINVSEKVINSISIGDNVEINIASYSSKPFNGKISTIAPGSSSDGTFPVTIEIQNPNNELKSGMFAEVNFVNNVSDGNVVLNKSAVLIDSVSEYVFIIEDKKAKRVNIKTGIDNGKEVEILEGITEGMDVVVNGGSYLNDGDSVRIVNNSETPAKANGEGE